MCGLRMEARVSNCGGGGEGGCRRGLLLMCEGVLVLGLRLRRRGIQDMIRFLYRAGERPGDAPALPALRRNITGRVMKVAQRRRKMALPRVFCSCSLRRHGHRRPAFLKLPQRVPGIEVLRLAASASAAKTPLKSRLDTGHLARFNLAAFTKWGYSSSYDPSLVSLSQSAAPQPALQNAKDDCGS